MGLLTLFTQFPLSRLEKEKPENQTLRIYNKENQTANKNI